MNIRISPSFYLLWLFFLISGRTQTVLIVFLSGMLHEAAHIYAYSACGIKHSDITLTACGISADFKGRTALSYKKEVLCLLSGGLCNLAFAAAFGITALLLPRVSGAVALCICNLCFAFLNLLPAYPLDGGRALFCILADKIPLYSAKKIVQGIALVFIVPLSIFAGWALWFTGYNVSLLLICCYLAYYVLSGR